MVLGYIILGLLIDRSMSGYDLKTFFNNSINFFWSAKLSQIYRELGKLEEQGYITHKIEKQEGRPDKKVYSITEEGKIAFTQWLKEFPKEISPGSRNEFLVRIFFSSKLPDEELIFQLKRYIKDKEEELKIYKTIEEQLDKIISEKGHNTDAFNQRFTVRRGLYFTKAGIDWANECIEDIKKIKALE